MPLGVEVGLGLGYIVLDGVPAELPKRGTGLRFSAHVYIVTKWSLVSATAELLLHSSRPCRRHVGATWRIRLNSCFLWPTRVHNPKRQIDRFSRFCTAHRSVPILYNGPPSPLKLAHSHEGMFTPSNKWFLGPNRILNPNGTLIGLAVFAGLTTVTDRTRDR